MHSDLNISNNRIKEIKKLHLKKYREENRLFIVEGEKAAEEILNEKIEIVDIYAVENYKPKFKHNNIKYISEQDMQKISTTSSACEILIVARQKNTQLKDVCGNNLILLDRISDPGNLGTIIRSASAFKIDGIILYGDSVELYSPKVIRSCAGNFFKVPIVNVKDISVFKQNYSDYKLVSTALREDKTINFEQLRSIGKKIIMFGSEADGLSDELLKIADYNVLINMSKNVESLNLSVSASIVMYENSIS